MLCLRSSATTRSKAAADGVPAVVTITVVLLRLVVGATFALSGFAKAIDPWGGYYKVADYAHALGWGTVGDLALVAAVALAAVEAVLGVLLLVGAYRRSVPLLLTLLMLVFTPLTVWLAVTDAVPDCGCFGDAIHLSNAASLAKNVLLLAALLMLVWLGRRVRGWYGPAVQWVVGALTLAVVLALAYVGYFEQPVIDFRPYKVGTRLAEPDSNDVVGDDDYVFIYEKDGVQREFHLDSVPDDDSEWQYVDRRRTSPQATRVIERGPHRFALLDESGDDVTNQLLGADSVLLLIFPDLPAVNVAHAFMLNELNDFAQAHGTEAIGVSAAPQREVEHWNDISMAEYNIYYADDADVKMLARGNPAVAFLSGGVVMWKRTLGSLNPMRLRDDEYDPATLGADIDGDSTLRAIAVPYGIAMALLLVINRLHLLLRQIFCRRPKDKAAPEPSEPAELSEKSNTAESAQPSQPDEKPQPAEGKERSAGSENGKKDE